MPFGVGCASGGLNKDGKHTVFERVIREDLPQADIVLSIGVAGFVVDLLSWRYAAAFLPRHAAFVFHFDEQSFWFSSRAEILNYVQDPRQYWRERGKRMDHPFLFFAALECNFDPEQTGKVSALETQRQELFIAIKTPFVPQDDSSPRPGSEAWECTLCRRVLQLCSAWEGALHLRCCHWGGTMPWVGTYSLEHILEQALVWVNRHLVEANSDLAVADTHKELRSQLGRAAKPARVADVPLPTPRTFVRADAVGPAPAELSASSTGPSTTGLSSLSPAGPS